MRKCDTSTNNKRSVQYNLCALEKKSNIWCPGAGDQIQTKCVHRRWQNSADKAHLLQTSWKMWLPSVSLVFMCDLSSHPDISENLLCKNLLYLLQKVKVISSPSHLESGTRPPLSAVTTSLLHCTIFPGSKKHNHSVFKPLFKQLCLCIYWSISCRFHVVTVSLVSVQHSVAEPWDAELF